jgi:dienelactone hydrolase
LTVIRAWIIRLIPVFACTIACAAPSPFHVVEKRGLYPVGFRVVEQYDYSRAYRAVTDALGKPYVGERARPVQTLLWYPAAVGNLAAMTVGDYVRLSAREIDFDRSSTPPSTRDFISGIESALDDPMSAVRDAALAQGRFPLVIYAPGASGVAWGNADLCEYLASYGYVVIASPSLGESTRTMTIDLVGATAQARDISFLIGFGRTLPNTQMASVAVVGDSWGGLAGLFAAARDNRVAALISLDGSLRYYPGLVAQAGDVHPEHMSIPLLAFLQRNFSMEERDRESRPESTGPSALLAWTHGDLTTVHMLQLSHTEFTAMSQRNNDRWWVISHADPMLQGDYGPEEGVAGYGWVARYSLRFLDAYLKHDASAASFLRQTPAASGVPPHLMTVSFRGASGTPGTLEAFRSEIGHLGFEHVGEVFKEFRKRDSAFKPNSQALQDWSEQLITDHHLPEAIQILEFSAELYPESSTAHSSLGDAYQNSGQKQVATTEYSKALQLDPTNGMAQLKLERLKGGTTGSPVRRVAD